MPKIWATTKEAYQLFHEGSLALAEAEFNGIRCDQDYCRRMIPNIERQVKSLTSQLDSTEIGKVWKARFGSRMSYSSDTQLRKILIDDLGFKSSKKTSKGNVSVDKEVLESVDRDDIRLLMKKRNLEKMSGTYLKNLLEESLADGYIHPFFHLSEFSDSKSGGARSFRGSSSDPNFQNQPNRHEDDRKLIRRAFLPRPGYRIVGRDYGAMEFRISACLHHDQNMIRYIENGDDPHRDVAAQCFLLDPELCTKKYGEFGKNVRHVGKNSVTFAQMYFQEPENTAEGIWKAIKDMDLRVPNDPEKKLISHLKDKKIGTFDSFNNHIVSKVIPWFWNEMFPEYGRWRIKWLEDYNKKGYFDMITGFRVEGVISKYQLGNYPIQGPAFHCLLWSMIQVHKLWKEKKANSKLIGQIHDELTTDEPGEEFEENQKVIPRIMAEDIRKAWPWIIVPLEVETEATPIDGNWYEKRGVYV